MASNFRVVFYGYRLIEFNSNKKWNPVCLNYCLNLLWHAFNEMIPCSILQVYLHTYYHLLHCIDRGNIPILLCNPTLHMCPYILNRVEIRGIEWVLITSHSKLFSDKNTNRFVNRSIIFHHNWLFHISKRLFSELFAWSCQDLILIHC